MSAIEVNGFLVNEDIETILVELRNQLHLRHIERFPKMRVSGRNLLTCCPFHGDGQEKKPSFGILLIDAHGRKAGTCHCFACNWAGSLQEMVSNCFGYDDFGAYGTKWLVKNFLTVAIETRPDIDLGLEAKNEKHVVNYISEEELDSYRYYHPYQKQRGLTDELIELFDVGYDKKSNAVTLPLRDKDGNCVLVAKRHVDSKFFELPSGVSKPLYGLYELYQLEQFPKTVYVCEGPFDALSFWRVGIPAVALLGTGNQLQLKQLRSLPCREIVLALDNDNAGHHASKKLSAQLNTKITKRVQYPENRKDAGECTDDELLSLCSIFY